MLINLIFSSLIKSNVTGIRVFSILIIFFIILEPFLISSSLLGILAQRLVRVLCNECKEEDVIAEDFAEDYNLSSDSKILPLHFLHMDCITTALS